jgi:phosphonatase-like hydrolase
MTIDLVVFDMAGTTVHDGDAVNRCFRAVMEAAGVAVDAAAVNGVMGLSKPEAIRRLLVSSGRAGDPAEIDAIHQDFAERMRSYYADDPSVREADGASAAFAALRRAGVKVALNTGFSRAIVDVILARLGWAALIDGSVAGDEATRGRPHPDMILSLMRRFGITDPRRVVKVGDTPVDLEEGSGAGCGLVIGVTTGSFTREQLRACPHTHLADSLAEVQALVLARPGSPT